MAILDEFFLRKEKNKKLANIIQIILILAAFICGIMFFVDKSMRPSRTTMMILVYAIKSAIILAYEYLAEHTERFRRFASLKAYMVLNILEILFWFTGFILMCMSGKACRGSSCGIVGVAATVALLLCGSFIVTAMIAWHNRRNPKTVPGQY